MLACTASSAAGVPSNPTRKHFLAFPSPLAEDAGGRCCGDREEQPARPVPEPGPVWHDGDLKSSSSSPAPALELIAGSRLQQQGPESYNPQADWSLQSSSSFAHPPSLIYPPAWPPYCQLRITASPSPPTCLCELSAAAASSRAASWVTTCAAVAFSL